MKYGILRLLGAALLAAALAACGASPSGGTASPPTPPLSATSSPSASPSPAGDPSCDELTRDWSTEAQSQDVNTIDPAVVNELKVDSKDCFDVLTFSTATTALIGFRVAYTDVVTSQGQGAPVPVTGAAVLEVVLYATSFCLPNTTSANPQPQPCWETGKVISGEGVVGPAITQVKYAGTQESRTTFAVGMAKKDTLFFVAALDDFQAGKTFVTVMVAHA
jgi:hypothetical protein